MNFRPEEPTGTPDNGSKPGSAKPSATTVVEEPKPVSPAPSQKDNPAADCRNMRRVIAEDPEWSLATVPLLWELCIKHIVHNFES